MARKAKAAAAAMPSGFKSYSNQVPAWNPEIGDFLQGTVMRKEILDAQRVGREKAKKGEKVTLLHVAREDTGEIVGVWESSALESVCKDAQQGDEIYLRLDAIKKKGKRRFKAFTVGLKQKKSK